MAEHLIIRLPPGAPDGADVAGNAAQWVVVDDTGACVLAPASGPLAVAAEAATGRRIIGLVPAARVLRTRVEVPVKGTNKVAQALPFALEDQLADDVDLLHFAAGARAVDGTVQAAVVRQDALTAWNRALADARLVADALYAESDGLAEAGLTTQLLLEDHQSLLRDPGADVVTFELDALPGVLEVWLAQPRIPGADGVLAPRHLQVYDATIEGVDNTLWEDIEGRVDSVEVRRLPDGALVRLAAGIASQPGVNLLQGDFARRASFGTWWPRWRLAASLVAVLCGAVVAATAADAWRLKRESAALEAELQQAVGFTFPGTPPGADIRALVDARLQGSASPATGSRDFLDTLQTVAGAVTRTGNASLETISYRSGVMELQIRAPSADTLDSIRKLVVENGRLKAEIQSSNAAGEAIQGRIRITRSGA